MGFPVALHFFNLLPGGHSSLEPRLPIPNRTVKRVCADDSVPFAHAKVGYRQTICKQKSPASKEDRAFLFDCRKGLVQYSAMGLPGEPVAPLIFSGDQTKRNS
jgi:hypothetical protein